MKRIFLLSCLLIAAIGNSFAYTTVIVQDSISSDTHWTCDNQYLLKGYVYVTAGTTLTIDGGTIIKGDKDTKGSLIIERGAKILAMGSASALRGMNRTSTYSAARGAQLAYVQALGVEVAPQDPQCGEDTGGTAAIRQ